mgnify:CR=1 FL=1
MEEGLHFRDLLRAEIAALLHHRQDVPPGREVVQAHVQVGEGLLRLGEDVVVEVDEYMVDQRAGAAQRLDEIDLRAPVGGEVLDQQRARAFLDMAFDLRAAAEALSPERSAARSVRAGP